MPSWGYLNDVPFLPVRIFGKDVSVSSLALVDAGAKSCVLHETLAKALGLRPAGSEGLRGFCGREKFRADLVSAEVELAGKKHTVTFASIGAARFPMVAPKIVLGRNLLNLFKLTLDGPGRKMIIE